MGSTPFRNSWSASLALFLASIAQTALPQAPIQPSPPVREHFERAQAALRANDAAAAEKEFRAVLALDPKNPGAHTGIGILDMSRGDYRAASDEFYSALAVQPSFTKALALRGICQKRLGDRSARGSLQKAFEKLQEKPLRVQVGLELAGLYEQQGDIEAAGALMRRLVQLDPENPDILFSAQRIYSDLADDTLNKLAVVAPGSARMQQAIAEHLVNEGDLKTAIEHYRKALEIEPRLPGVRYELAEALLMAFRGDPARQAEAEKELNTVIATEGDNAKVQCVLGEIAFDRSDLAGARAHFDRALTLDPVNSEAQIGLGRILMAMDKPQEARKYLEMAVHSDPLNGPAHYQLAQACRKLQITDEAKKEFQLSQEIKKTRDQVEELYHQMNRQSRPQADEVPDTEQQ